MKLLTALISMLYLCVLPASTETVYKCFEEESSAKLTSLHLGLDRSLIEIQLSENINSVEFFLMDRDLDMSQNCHDSTEFVSKRYQITEFALICEKGRADEFYILFQGSRIIRLNKFLKPEIIFKNCFRS